MVEIPAICFLISNRSKTCWWSLNFGCPSITNQDFRSGIQKGKGNGCLFLLFSLEGCRGWKGCNCRFNETLTYCRPHRFVSFRRCFCCDRREEKKKKKKKKKSWCPEFVVGGGSGGVAPLASPRVWMFGRRGGKGEGGRGREGRKREGGKAITWPASG